MSEDLWWTDHHHICWLVKTKDVSRIYYVSSLWHISSLKMSLQNLKKHTPLTTELTCFNRSFNQSGTNQSTPAWANNSAKCRWSDFCKKGAESTSALVPILWIVCPLFPRWCFLATSHPCWVFCQIIKDLSHENCIRIICIIMINVWDTSQEFNQIFTNLILTAMK